MRSPGPLAALLLGLGVACGASPEPRPAPRPDRLSREPQTLTESQAREAILEVLREAGVSGALDWEVVLSASPGVGRVQLRAFSVDVRVASSRFGLEWVSPEDREELGGRLAPAQDDGQLRVVRGSAQDADVQILALDPRQYQGDLDAPDVQRGAPGLEDARSRLQRDVRDFLEYVRGQGGLE